MLGRGSRSSAQYLANRHGIKVTWLDADAREVLRQVPRREDRRRAHARRRVTPASKARTRASCGAIAPRTTSRASSRSTSTRRPSQSSYRPADCAATRASASVRTASATARSAAARRHSLALEPALQALDDAPQGQVVLCLHGDPHVREAVVGLTASERPRIPVDIARARSCRRLALSAG